MADLLRTTDVTTQLDFAQLLRNVGEYRSRIVPRFIGEAREEVQTIFDALES